MAKAEPSTQSAAERRAAEAAVAALVAKFAPAHESLVASARKSLRKRLPTAFEVVYEYRSWFVISYSPTGQGYEGVLAIRGDADGVKLYLTQGKDLPDPEKLLRGSAQARWIDVDAGSMLARPAVARLIDEAISRNRVPFAPTGRGPVVMKSVTGKPRPRARSA